MYLKEKLKYRKLEWEFKRLYSYLSQSAEDFEELKIYGKILDVPENVCNELEELRDKALSCLNRVKNVRLSFLEKDYRFLNSQIDQALFELADFNTRMELLYPKLYGIDLEEE